MLFETLCIRIFFYFLLINFMTSKAFSINEKHSYNIILLQNT